MIGHGFFLVLLIGAAHTQKQAGDFCLDEHTQTVGVCKPARECVTAKDDYNRNGIRPTFCTHSFEDILICCRDGVNILQTPQPNKPQSSSRQSSSDQRRLSERKCEEYSREVTETVEFFPLVPDPETLSISTSKCNYSRVELIVGGEDATLGEFPHMAAIGWVDYDGEYVFNCGGSLISSRFVLTAAHCTSDPRAKDPQPSIVRLGDQNIDPSVKDFASPVDVPIKALHQHPDYKSPVKYNDIALLELNSDVDFDASVRPACLWSRGDFAGHRQAVATGWGVTDARTQIRAKELQKVSLTLLENNNCDRLLRDHWNRHWQGFRPTQMCAGELRGGKDTCQGDSGSPLQVASSDNHCIFHVVGVVSFGRSCAKSGKPAVYTRVSSYLDWIESVVWPGE